MPEWLTKTEHYVPLTDRDTFVDRSILSILKLIAKIRGQGRMEKDLLWVSPFFKLLYTLLFIVLLSVSRSFSYVYAMVVYTLVVVCLLPGEKIRKVLGGSLLATLFTGLLLLPAALAGNHYSAVMIPVKVFATITAVNMLSVSTRWDRLTGSFKQFHLPDLFIIVLDITIKYIVRLGEFALELLYALKLRSVGKNRRKYSSLGGITGTLFLKSREMSEEMYHAMTCRGFTGEYRTHDRFRFTAADGVCTALNAGMTLLFFYLQGSS